MRYVGGCVLKKIRSKYEKKTDDISHQFLSCIEKLTMADDSSDEDVLSYTRRWFCTVDRGGLFPINDAAFLFFVGIEKVQSTLPEYMSKRYKYIL